jgi:hypothetical protein
MKTFVFTTAVALVLATGAYAQNHHGGGGGGGMSAGAAARGPSMGGGGPGPSFSTQRGPSGPVGAGTMGPGRGPTGGLYNYSQSRTGSTNFSRNNERFTGRTPQRENNIAGRNQERNIYNYAGRNQGRESDQGRNRSDFRKGIVSGNFFEHGRHFRFRRFFNGEWVFLTDWNDCTAWAWVNIAPGVWAWRPIDVCIG